jgi:hypothetical protein
VDLIPEQWRNRLYPRFENNAGQLPRLLGLPAFPCPALHNLQYSIFFSNRFSFFAALAGSRLRISKKQASGANEKP